VKLRAEDEGPLAAPVAAAPVAAEPATVPDRRPLLVAAVLALLVILLARR
jgi:hypothetical protein